MGRIAVHWSIHLVVAGLACGCAGAPKLTWNADEKKPDQDQTPAATSSDESTAQSEKSESSGPRAVDPSTISNIVQTGGVADGPQHTVKHDPETLKLIDRELRDATDEERERWYRDLKQLDPYWVRQVLRTRRLSIDMQQKQLQQLAGPEPGGSANPPTANAGYGSAPAEFASHTNPSQNTGASPGGELPAWAAGESPPRSGAGPFAAQFGHQTSPQSQGQQAPQQPGAIAPWAAEASNNHQTAYAPQAAGEGAPPFPAASAPPAMQPRNLLPSAATNPLATPWNMIRRVTGNAEPTNGPGRVAWADPAANPNTLSADGTALSPSQWLAELHRLTALAETDVAGLTPGGTEAEQNDYIEKHVNLRWLYLLSGQRARALEAIPDIPPADQEFWQQLLWSVSNYFDADSLPDSTERATQTIEQLRTAVQKLQPHAKLELRNVNFCHKISGYGNYERFPRDEFSPGQPVLIYAEVGNFKSEPTTDGRFRTLLRSTIEIYKTGPGGGLVKREEFPPTEDLCRNHRKDYFHSYQIDIPSRATLGPHVLKLIVEDQLSQKVATYSLNCMVK